jgi:hypothetical protein
MEKSGGEFGWHRKQLKKRVTKEKLNVPPTTVYRIRFFLKKYKYLKAYDVDTDNTILENFGSGSSPVCLSSCPLLCTF